MIKPQSSYHKIRYYVDVIEGSHNTIMSRGMKLVREFGDAEIIEEYRNLIEQRRLNQANLANAEGYLEDTELLSKLATLSGQTDIAIECGEIIMAFRDNMETLQKVLRDIRLSQLHAGLCANAYNN